MYHLDLPSHAKVFFYGRTVWQVALKFTLHSRCKRVDVNITHSLWKWSEKHGELIHCINRPACGQKAAASALLIPQQVNRYETSTEKVGCTVVTIDMHRISHSSVCIHFNKRQECGTFTVVSLHLSTCLLSCFYLLYLFLREFSSAPCFVIVCFVTS